MLPVYSRLAEKNGVKRLRSPLFLLVFRSLRLKEG